MKNAWIAAVAVGVGLAGVVLVERRWRAAQPEESAAARRGVVGESDTDTSRRSAAGGLGAANPGSARPGAAGAGGGRASGDDPSDSHRAGGAAVVRGVASAGGDGSTAGAGAADRERVGSIGATRLDLRPGTTRREVPDMPRQLGNGGLDSVDAQNEQPPPEPAPEVAYDGGADHVFGTDWQVEVPDAGRISGEAGTVSFWLKPQWAGTNQDDATFVQLGDSGMQIVKNVDYLRFEYIDSTGKENGLGLNIADWKPGDWHQVTSTWTNGNLALYIDGQLISQNHYANPPTFGSETKLYVGSNFPGTPVAQGDISYLRVLNRDSPASEVSNQFRSGPRPNN